MKLWPGAPYPLGATYDGTVVNFSVFSEFAERVQLCIYDDDGEETRADLPEVHAFCWHGYLPNAGPGLRYGFRVHGSFDPDNGVRCNSSKLLLDPYAKAIEGEVEWREAVFSYHFDDPDGALNEQDSAPFVSKSVVTSPFFDWDNDRPPRVARDQTIIYEVHVKGFTQMHPDIPEELRGTYAGLTHPAALDYLKSLGITAVELLPVHQFIHDSHLADKGLRNYWGYNSIGFMAPHNGYSSSGQSGQQVSEFKQMVKNLHAEGIEVILDVVYNHTAEGNHLGPTLSFKGLDNPAYYRLVDDDKRFYFDTTGTGNSLNVAQPHVLQLIMDSLRYWVTEMHVDGFRFDLAATLARQFEDVDRLSAFFDLIHQDPVVSQVKLIAEPWDLGEGGYQVGNFPPLWSEWNGKYRDSVREFWLGETGPLSDFAYRLMGSSDLYEATGRRPSASVNFITAHDGFTLADLTAYNDKHNEANGEDNNDGESHNRSWNCGAEGETGDPEVNALRSHMRRNLMATLLLSQGMPMILGGDEFARSQGGNNNAYCQDNEISWFNWEDQDEMLLEFTRHLVAFRRQHPVFHRPNFFQGRAIIGHEMSDLAWFRNDGAEMEDEDWAAGLKTVAVFLNGDAMGTHDPRGEPIVDDSFLMFLNAHVDPVDFTIPSHLGDVWEKVVDTLNPVPFEEETVVTKGGDAITVPSRTIAVFQLKPAESPSA
ncbi:MAG: glycogen debranching protein GlgX [Actinomycetota bacterium]